MLRTHRVLGTHYQPTESPASQEVTGEEGHQRQETETQKDWNPEPKEGHSSGVLPPSCSPRCREEIKQVRPGLGM